MANVIIVNTPGPQGPVGPQGPQGSIGTLDTGSFVTTSSFNLITASVDTLTFEVGTLDNEVNDLQLYTSSINNFTSSYNTGSFTGSFIGIFTGSISAVDFILINQSNPLPTSLPIGAFAVSSSTPPKPYFWDGTDWNALY